MRGERLSLFNSSIVLYGYVCRFLFSYMYILPSDDTMVVTMCDSDVCKSLTTSLLSRALCDTYTNTSIQVFFLLLLCIRSLNTFFHSVYILFQAFFLSLIHSFLFLLFFVHLNFICIFDTDTTNRFQR